MEGNRAYDMSCHFLCSTGVGEEADDLDEEVDHFLDEDSNMDESEPPKIDLDMLDDDNDDGEYISDSEEPELTLTDGNQTFYGRDKKTIWSSKPLERDFETRIFDDIPGCTNDAKKCKSPSEAWNLFFTNDMLERIVECTNLVINSMKSKSTQEKSANPTNVAEIKAVVGLTYIIGALRAAHLNTSWLWATDGTGIELFPCLMSLRRFIFLLRTMRFEKDIPSQDPLSSFRWLLEKFNVNCQRNFVMNEKCILDSTFVPFRGSCPFLRYMPREIAKYGIKLYCLVDSESQYINKLDICVEKQLRSENGYMIVKNMCRSIMGSSRILILCNNRFGSVHLAEYLLDNNIRSVCELKRNSLEIPSLKTLRSKSVPRFYRKGVLLQSADCKNVIYSTFGVDDSDKNDLENEIFRMYNNSKDGFECAIKTCNEFSLSRKSSRWSLAMFYFLLNVAAANSQIIIENNTNKSSPGMDFMKNLGRALVHDHLQVRANTLTLPKHLLGKARQFAGTQNDDSNQRKHSLEPPFKKLKRCDLCPRSADRKTREWCIKCRVAACPKHSHRICVNCVDN